MKYADIAVIGAGLLGCFAARALCTWDVHPLVLEQREDVCTGISKANTGIVYTGCDTKPGTLKTRLCVRANQTFDTLCRELDVPFSRCGSLMIAFGPRAERVLESKYALGLANGVPGIEMLERRQVLQREPNLASSVTKGLFVPGTGTVDPWELGIAAYENAQANGARFHFNEKLIHLSRTGHGFLLETDRQQYVCRSVINCAGLQADTVREMLQIPCVRIIPSAGDYLILDTCAGDHFQHIIFHEPEIKGKGLTLVPTVDGNLLVGPTERDTEGMDHATSGEGLELLHTLCAQVAPNLPIDQVIRNFGALRPNPYQVHQEQGAWVPEATSISNFTVLEEDGLFSLIGIKTPGLTCAAELGRYVAEKAAAYLGCDRPNPAFDPLRRGIRAVRKLDERERAELVRSDPAYGQIVCRCREISKGEVLEAIRRGASTVDGVKRRVGAGMGRCQGGYCMQTILETLAEERGLSPASITKDGGGTRVLYGKTDASV